jgi:hypothetical protein
LVDHVTTTSRRMRIEGYDEADGAAETRPATSTLRSIPRNGCWHFTLSSGARAGEQIANYDDYRLLTTARQHAEAVGGYTATRL